MCCPHITPKIGWMIFISVCRQMNMRPAVGWQVLACTGLLHLELLLSFYTHTWKESTEVWIWKNWKRKRKLLPKKWRDTLMKDKYKQTEAELKLFWQSQMSLSIRNRQNVSVKFLCVCVPFVRRSLHFLLRVSSFFSYFLCIYTHIHMYIQYVCVCVYKLMNSKMIVWNWLYNIEAWCY